MGCYGRQELPSDQSSDTLSDHKSPDTQTLHSFDHLSSMSPRHHRLPNQPLPSKFHRTSQSRYDHAADDNEPPSAVGQPGMPEPMAESKGPKSRFTPKDDALLVQLKESTNLTWKQITEFFPGKSSGTLQVRYCTKLNAKNLVWTDDMLDRLRQSLVEYEHDRWRIISGKVGNGFSAAACEKKVVEMIGIPMKRERLDSSLARKSSKAMQVWVDANSDDVPIPTGTRKSGEDGVRSMIVSIASLDHEGCTSHEGAQDTRPAESPEPPSGAMGAYPRYATPAIFAEIKTSLDRLRLDLQYLGDGDEDSLSEVSSFDCEPWLTSQYSSVNGHPSDEGDRGYDSAAEPPGAQSGQNDPTSPAQKIVPGDRDHQGLSRKRRRTDGSGEDRCQPTLKQSQKRARPGVNERLICCFKDDLHDPCPGTDKTISDIVRTLAKFHNIHICRNCWVLLVRDDSGRALHPSDDCVNHCLSPRCLGEKARDTTPPTDHRHLFVPSRCGTQSSRSRPEDLEAIYRFIFSLVQPASQQPTHVFATEVRPHVGMIARQGRRKPGRDVLTVEVEELGRQLEELRQQHVTEVDLINRLKRDIQDAQEKTNRLDEKNSTLQARMRRIVAILGDAMRIGVYYDEHSHRSLVGRITEDAPDALKFLAEPLFSLPDSAQSDRSGTAPDSSVAQVAGQDQLFQDMLSSYGP